MQVVEALQQTGAALITIHGRTMQQGYRKTADWDLIEQAAAASTIPIVGNGDVLTYYEVGTPGRIAKKSMCSEQLGGTHKAADACWRRRLLSCCFWSQQGGPTASLGRAAPEIYRSIDAMQQLSSSRHAD